jgi:hypothetical protein
MLVVAALVALMELQMVLEVLVEVVLVVFLAVLMEFLELQTRVAEVVAALTILEQQEATAVPVLSFCLTHCQKAQPLNSCLLRHGKHQQASLPLIT